MSPKEGCNNTEKQHFEDVHYDKLRMERKGSIFMH